MLQNNASRREITTGSHHKGIETQLNPLHEKVSCLDESLQCIMIKHSPEIHHNKEASLLLHLTS